MNEQATNTGRAVLAYLQSHPKEKVIAIVPVTRGTGGITGTTSLAGILLLTTK